MRVLRKINKGLVLTIIVLLVLSIYLVCVEATRNKEKPEIEKVCSEYIDLVNKYSVLPEDAQKIYGEEQIQNGEKDKINEELKKSIEDNTNKFEEELKTKMIESDIARNMQKELVETYLTDNNDAFSAFISKLDKKITKIRKFEFDDTQVTVTFDTKTDIETKYLGEGEALTNKDTYNSGNETITLKKVEEKWKVVSADLTYFGNAPQSSTIGGMVTFSM